MKKVIYMVYFKCEGEFGCSIFPVAFVDTEEKARIKSKILNDESCKKNENVEFDFSSVEIDIEL